MVETLSSTTLVADVAFSKVAEDVEIVPTAEVGAVKMDSLPPTSSSPPARDQALKSTIEREKEEEKKKKKKLAIMKVFHKAHPDESNDDSDDPKEDRFNNLEIIQALIDKFTMLEVVDNMADLDHMQLI
ncbi:hypothetical protein COCNU_scaffold000542G000010 [Cocos nucifera]|nr:hypothetical protein [Cocos nucifera]